jgi:hypothetical protein
VGKCTLQGLGIALRDDTFLDGACHPRVQLRVRDRTDAGKCDLEHGEADWTKKSWNPNEVVMFRMLIHISSFHPSGAHNFAHNIVFRRHTRRHSPGFEPKRHGRVRLCALPGVS